jgi:hypothetical protein
MASTRTQAPARKSALVVSPQTTAGRSSSYSTSLRCVYVAGKASSAVRDPWRESSLRATSSSEASTAAGVPAASIVEWTGRCCRPVAATERERRCSLLLPLSWMHDDLAEASKALFASVKGRNGRRRSREQRQGRARRFCFSPSPRPVSLARTD